MKYLKKTVCCNVCGKPLVIYEGVRSNRRRFCSDLCREKSVILESNERWLKKKDTSPHSKKKDKHPWLKRFQDMY
jgi:hypothetical protein